MRTRTGRLHTGLAAPRLVFPLPLCDKPTPGTECTCGGLLAYVAGVWRHVAACLNCLDAGPDADPCFSPELHAACAAPEYRVCCHVDDTWHCNEPVGLEVPCAYGREERACCGCCWVTADQAEGRLWWPTSPWASLPTRGE